jgi:hypothetical protein
MHEAQDVSMSAHRAQRVFQNPAIRCRKSPSSRRITGFVRGVRRESSNFTAKRLFTVMTGLNHIYAAREGLGAIVTWLRWHLAGEVDRKAMSIGPSCHFCTGKFASKSKNF